MDKTRKAFDGAEVLSTRTKRRSATGLNQALSLLTPSIRQMGSVERFVIFKHIESESPKILRKKASISKQVLSGCRTKEAGQSPAPLLQRGRFKKPSQAVGLNHHFFTK